MGLNNLTKEELIAKIRILELESESKLKEAQQIGKMGHWSLDIVNNKLHWSDEIFRIFELKPQQFNATYEAFLDNIHPDDREMVNKAYSDSLVTKKPYNIVHRLSPKGDIIKYVREKGVTEFDKNGKPINSIGTVQDITEQVGVTDLIKKTLSENETKYKTIFDNTTLGIYETSIDGKIITANDALVKMLGYSSLKDLKKRDLNTEGFEKQTDRADFIRDVETKGALSGLDSIWLKANGEKVFVRESSVAVRDADHKILYYQGIIEDVTQRRLDQKALREREKNYQDLIEKSKIGISINNIDGNLTYCNQKFLELFGYTEEEVKNQSLHALIHPDDFEMVLNYHKKRLQGEEVTSQYNCKAITKGKEIIHIEVNVVPIIEDRKILGTRTYIWDITERKIAEEKLKLSEEKFRTLNEISPIGILLSSLDGKIIDMNPALKNMMKVQNLESLSNLLTTNFYSNIKDREEVLFLLKKNGTIKSKDLALNRLDGKQIWVNFNAILYTSPNGETLLLSTFSDITEAKFVEEKLKTYKHFFENSRDLPCVANTQGYFEIINPQYTKSLGYSEEELLKESYFNFIHPDDVASIQKEIEKLTDGAVVTNFTCRFRKKDGNYLWLDWNASPDPLTGKLFAIARDITERKQAEKEIEKTSSTLTLATRAGGIGIWEYDVINNILKWDDEMYHIYGITAETFGGAYESWKQGLHPDDVERGNKEIEAAIRGEKDFDTEFRVIWPDDSIHYVKAFAETERDANGNTLRLIGTNYDITDKKQREIELQTFATNLKDAQELAHAGNWSIDLATNKIIWSDETCRILGLDPRAIVPSTGLFLSCIHPDDVEILRTRIIENIDSQKPGEANFRVIRKDGTIGYVLGKSNFYLDDSEKPSQYYGVLQDVTEAKETENSLKEISNRLNEAQAIARVGSWEVDMKTNQSRWTDETYTLLGLDPKTTIPTVELYQSCIHPDDADFVKEKVNENFTHGTASEFSARLINQNNGELIYTMSRTNVEKNKDGNLIRLYGTIQDITEIKKIEIELVKRTQELETFNNSMLDREMRIIELKEEINNLCKELKKALKFPPVWK